MDFVIYTILIILLLPLLGTTLAMLVGVLTYLTSRRGASADQNAAPESLQAFVDSLRTAAGWLGTTVAEVAPAGAAALGARPLPVVSSGERRTDQRRLQDRRRGERRTVARNGEDRRLADRRRDDRRDLSTLQFN